MTPASAHAYMCTHINTYSHILTHTHTHTHDCFAVQCSHSASSLKGPAFNIYFVCVCVFVCMYICIYVSARRGVKSPRTGIIA
jgi:hypothetical protein